MALKWRTSTQVAADNAHEAEVKRQKQLKETTNLLALAQLNVATDEHCAVRKSRVIRRISDIPEEASDNAFVLPVNNNNDRIDEAKNGVEESDEDGGVDEDGQDSIDDMDVNSESELAEELPKQTKKTKKQVSEHSSNPTRVQPY